jgi:hypothetical protein
MSTAAVVPAPVAPSSAAAAVHGVGGGGGGGGGGSSAGGGSGGGSHGVGVSRRKRPRTAKQQARNALLAKVRRIKR